MYLSIIIPSKNGLHHLKDCLPSVINAKLHAKFKSEIIVIDDNSTDKTLKYAPKEFPLVKFLSNPKKGCCSARNYGVANSSGSYLCFLDNDVFLEADFFNTANKYLNPDMFLLACAGYKYEKAGGGSN